MEDITISLAHSCMKEKKKLPKFQKPSIFCPKNGNAVKFMNKYEQCAHINCWTDCEKIYFLESYVSHYAKFWCTNFTKNTQNGNKTWSDLKNAFLKEFSNRSYLHKLKFSLGKIKQGETESIRNFLFRVLDKCYHVELQMPFDKVLEFFENGLHDSYLEKYYFFYDPEMNLTKLRQIVFKINEALTREKLSVLKYNSFSPRINNTIIQPKLFPERYDMKFNKKSCFYCSKNHFLKQCKIFRKLTIQNGTTKSCYICLQKHLARDCKTNIGKIKQ